MTAQITTGLRDAVQALRSDGPAGIVARALLPEAQRKPILLVALEEMSPAGPTGTAGRSRAALSPGSGRCGARRAGSPAIRCRGRDVMCCRARCPVAGSPPQAPGPAAGGPRHA